MAATGLLQQVVVWVGRMSWQASVLVLLVLVVQWLFQARLTPRWRYALWWLVLIRLLLPVAPETPFSIFNVVKGRAPAPHAALIPEDLPQDDRWSELSPARPLPAARPEPPAVATPMIADQAVPAVPSGANPSPAPAAPQVVLPLLLWSLVGAWAVGMGLLLSRVLWGNLGFAQRLRRRGLLADPVLREILEECRRVVGVSRPVAVIETPDVDSPALFGCFRVKLLLPPGLAETFSRAELRHVFLHELAHLRRWDVPTNWLMTLLQIVHWFNPVIWLASSRMRADRELACDALALSLIQSDESQSYGQTIIRFLEGYVRPAAVPGLVGILEDKAQMKRRIHMIARFKKTSRWPILAVALFVGLGLVTLTDARDKSQTPSFSAGGTDAAGTGAQKAAAGAQSSGIATPSADDDIVDPNTGLRFTVAKRISAENDEIIHNNAVSLSPNGKFLLWRGRVTPLDGAKPFKLGVGEPRDEAWSPDGKLIAYRKGSGIWLLPVSPETGQPTGPARKLGDDPAIWSNGVILWSADSQCIMLRYREQGKGLVPVTERCLSVRDGRLMQSPDYTRFALPSPDQKSLAYFSPDNSVWTAPVGGGATRLVLGRRGGIVTVPLWWSPDAQWLLCGVSWYGYSYDDFRFVRLADHREVALKFPEQSGRVGFRAEGLGLSPDGRKLQFFKNSHDLRSATKVASLRGGGFTELPFSRQFDRIDIQEVRGPDGQGLVFAGWKQGKWALYVAPASGGEPVEVKLNVSLSGDRGVWLVSPDGTRLFIADYAMRGKPRPVGDLYVIPISLEQARSTGPAIRIAREWERSSHYYPHDDMAWSPDSKRLAIYGGAKGDRDLWVMPADGSPPRQITQNREDYLKYVTWSPDGKFIAYSVTSPGPQAYLYTVSAEGGAPKRLRPNSGGWAYTWSPDSKEIEVDSQDGLVSVAIADGSVRPFLKLAEVRLTWLDWLRWSPDSQTLALYGGDGNGCQTVLYRASDKKAELLPPDPPWKNALGWTADSQALFCVTEQPDRIRPAALVHEVDLMEAWAQAKNSVVGASLPASASPTTRPEVPPLVNGEFRDDFEDGDTKYWTFEDLPNQAPYRVREVQNGELVLENCFACLDAPEWTDYVVTVKMCLKRIIAESGAGAVHLRRDERGAAYGVAVGIGTPAPLVRLNAQYSGTDTWFHGGTLAERPYDFAIGKWYTLQVEVKGPRIVVRVDGQPLIDVSDESFSRGSVRLLSNGARVHFDDFSVRQLP